MLTCVSVHIYLNTVLKAVTLGSQFTVGSLSECPNQDSAVRVKPQWNHLTVDRFHEIRVWKMHHDLWIVVSHLSAACAVKAHAHTCWQTRQLWGPQTSPLIKARAPMVFVSSRSDTCSWLEHADAELHEGRCRHHRATVNSNNWETETLWQVLLSSASMVLILTSSKSQLNCTQL